MGRRRTTRDAPLHRRYCQLGWRLQMLLGMCWRTIYWVDPVASTAVMRRLELLACAGRGLLQIDALYPAEQRPAHM